MLRCLLICLISFLVVSCVPTSNKSPRPHLISGHHQDIYPLNFREIISEHVRDNYRFARCYIDEPRPSEFNSWVGNFVLTNNRDQNALFVYRLSEQGEVRSKQIDADPYEIVEIKEKAERGEIRNPALIEYRERHAFYRDDQDDFDREHARMRAFQREQFAHMEAMQREQAAQMQAMLYQAERMRREEEMRYQEEMAAQQEREEMEYERRREAYRRDQQEARKRQQQRERKEAAQREKQRKDQLAAQQRREKLVAQQRKEQAAAQQQKKPKPESPASSSSDAKDLERFMREAGDI